MKTNYTTQPEKAYEKPGEWTTNVYTTTSYEMPALNAIIETVMSIENQELVFAEGNNGNASAESVAVATMSTGKKKVVVVDGTTQICTLDEDNNTVIPITVFNYRGPLRTGDIDITVDGVINATALASIATVAAAPDVAGTITTIMVEGDEVYQHGFANIENNWEVIINGTNLTSGLYVRNRITREIVTPHTISDTLATYNSWEVDNQYDIVLNNEEYAVISCS